MPSPSATPPSSQVTLVLRISGGSFATGFSASLSISEPGRVNPQQRYQLPPCAELPAAYQRWQTTYGALTHTRQIKPIAGQTTQRSYEERRSDCRRETITFEDKCSEWFHQPTFEALRRSIFSEVHLRQLKQVPILLEADTNELAQDVLLRKLPWHLWKLLEQDLRSSELIVSAPVAPSNHQFSGPVNILAVFGSRAGGIQLSGDLAALEQLRLNGANLVLLDQPSSKSLQEALWKQPWDVLFFAGHSASCADTTGGIIYLKDGITLSLRDLKSSLNRAVENGLKLAIFNSCDGLSLADYLAERRVPVSIVMREPVPDIVARHFLEYFLEEFSQGEINLHAAVRKARERLQWLESNGENACPAATWLPIVFQNPNQSPLFWPPHAPEPLPAALLSAPTPPTQQIALQPSASQETASPQTAPPQTAPPQTASPQPAPPQMAPPQTASQQTASQQTQHPISSPTASQPSFSFSHSLFNTQPAPNQPSTANPASLSRLSPKPNKQWRKGALLLLVAILLWKGGSWLRTRFLVEPALSGLSEEIQPQQPSVYGSVEERFSEGDRELIKKESDFLKCPGSKQTFEQLKAEGIRAMANQNYEMANTIFEQALEECPSPEVVIYNHNAAIGTAEAYTLAVTVPYTPYPDNAVQMLRGTGTAQEQINDIDTSGGINGKPLRILLVEDSDSPEAAAEIAKVLIDERPDVIGALGHWTSGVSDEAFKVYERKQQLAFITPVSTATDLVSSGSNWVFRATVDSYKTQSAIVEHLSNPKGDDASPIDKVAIFYVDAARTSEDLSLYSWDLTRQFEKLFGPAGGQVVNRFSFADPRFEENAEAAAREMVATAKSNGAQAVLLAPNSSLVTFATSVIEAASAAKLTVLGEVNLFRQSVLDHTCPASEGMIISLPWHVTGQANPAFVEAARSLWGGDVSPATAMTYNATQAMAAAIRLSPGKPTRASVKEALNRDDFESGMTADAEPFTFQDNTRAADAQLVKVVLNSEQTSGCAFQAIE
ncbi:MAG: ABC transporter substrate-binding protein [Phormidesmis sp.]